LADQAAVAGMVTVLHPNLIGAAGASSATAGGTYVIGNGRAERLSRVPLAVRRIAT
jgi:hypothetical protein